MNARETRSGGVDGLIQRLQAEGIEAGRKEAERIVATAHAEADLTRAEARSEADALLGSARAETERQAAAARGALDLALRDAVLLMRESIEAHLRTFLLRRARAWLDNEEWLRSLAFEAAVAAAAGRAAEVELPESPKLDATLRDLLADALREQGLELSGRPGGKGIRLRLDADGVAFDLDDDAIADLLLERLSPALRRVFEQAGVAVLTGMD